MWHMVCTDAEIAEAVQILKGSRWWPMGLPALPTRRRRSTSIAANTATGALVRTCLIDLLLSLYGYLFHWIICWKLALIVWQAQNWEGWKTGHCWKTLSLSHVHFHTFTFTLSFSHFHFHRFKIGKDEKRDSVEKLRERWGEVGSVLPVPGEKL